jgi:hypothetical protein
VKNISATDQNQLQAAGFVCSVSPKPAFHLSKKEEIGIGIGLGIPVLALLVWLLAWRVKIIKIEEAKRKEWEGNRLPGYHLAALDRAPRYSHLSGTDQGPLISASGNATQQAHAGSNEDDRSREERVDQHNSI